MLRQEGLAAAVGKHHEVLDGGELALPPGRPGRGAETSLVNESALLGTIPALRNRGRVGLVFVDGHEDTMPLDVAEDGEAANAEIGLLLGITGRLLRGPLAERLPALGREDLAMIGQRDARWRR